MDPKTIVVIFRGAIEVPLAVAARFRPEKRPAAGMAALLVADALSPGSVSEDDLTQVEDATSVV